MYIPAAIDVGQTGNQLLAIALRRWNFLSGIILYIFKDLLSQQMFLLT